MKKILCLAGLLFAGVANASMITVDYEVTYNGNYWGIGTFSGTDSNSDNVLTFDELTSFDGSTNVENATVNLTTLFDVGDFNILSDIWLNNAVSWNGYADEAWFTWNNRNNSVNSEWAVVTTSSTSVPEPASLVLLGLGLAGLGFSRKRKTA